MSTQAPVRSLASAEIQPGVIVGGRFAVEGIASRDPIGVVASARDQKTQKAIALRLVAPSWSAKPAAVEVLRAELKIAASITHKNAVSTYGTGVDPNGAFVACEWIEGQRLDALVQETFGKGERLPLRTAFTILSHVTDALLAAHERNIAHGTLRPAVVWIASSGRTKVSEFGLGRALLRAGHASAFSKGDQAFLAPETRGGRLPDPRSDVFGIGGLLYVMLTGKDTESAFVEPSRAHPEATSEIDKILMRCLASDPAQRFASPREVRDALAPLCGGPAGDRVELQVDIPIDMASNPPAARPSPTSTGSGTRPAPPRVPLAPKPPAMPGRPAVGARVSIHEEFRASAVPQVPIIAPLDAPADRVSEVDLGQLLGKITENDAARWMVVKDNLDHGPFSGRELVQLIAKGEVLAQHTMLNMDTGQRKKVAEFAEFVEFLEQYRIKKSAEDEKKAIARSAKVEKASNAVKFMIAGSIVVVVGTALTLFFLSRNAEQQRLAADAHLADLYERGDVQIEGAGGILPDPPRGSGRHARAHRSGGGGGGGLSYEEAMNQAVDMGDVSRSGGGESRLSPQQVVAAVNGRAFLPCVSAELRGGRSLGRVRIEIAIAGSGQVLGSSVGAGSPEFQHCVQRAMASQRFPSFGAPRMGASYTFDASP